MPRGGKRVGAGRKRTRPEKPATQRAVKPAAIPAIEAEAPAPPSSVNPLLGKCTRKEQAFILNLLADPTGNQTHAYERAGFKARGDSARANAAKCLAKDRCRAAFDSLRTQMLAGEELKAIADATERRAWLTKMMRDGEAHPIVRLKAVDIQNRMDGLYMTKFGVAGADGKTVAPRRVIFELDDASANANP